MSDYYELCDRGMEGSVISEASSYFDRYDGQSHPPKPPRKAPSTSPPSLRRSKTTMAHYSAPSNQNQFIQLMRRDDNIRKRFFDSSNNDDSAIASGGDGGGTDDASGSSPAYRFSSFHSPHSAQTRPSPPDSISPSRNSISDMENLRSPMEVLYAVSDKQRKARDHPNHVIGNSKSGSMSSQASKPDLRQNPTGYYTKNPNRPSRNMSREDLNVEENPYQHTGRRSASLQQSHQSFSPPRYYSQTSRSLERFGDRGEPENSFKMKIQVISPERNQSPGVGGGRKPYKTTINTATDNIQYRVDSIENLRRLDYYQQRRNEGDEHYKVPKNRAPVQDQEYYQQQQRPLSHPHQVHRRRQQPNRNNPEDSDFSIVSNNPSQTHRSTGARSQMSSTGLVKSAELRHYRHPGTSRDLDREGRSIRRDGRHYSGCSTSPDRDVSPDGYARPSNNAKFRPEIQNSSPDLSPVRPPRSKSSPVNGSNKRLNGLARHYPEQPRNGMQPHSLDSTMVRQNSAEGGEDRFSRFTEYRGDEGNEVAKRYSVADQPVSDRERGRSLPPGASIESMRDFYKSSQFKSMYALPPSPNRPAPVLERSQSRRTPRMMDGEIIDDTLPIPNYPRTEPIRPTRSIPNMPRPSSKRPAPIPPGIANGVPRRVVSSDRVGPGIQREVRPHHRGSSVDGLDSSFSESEGLLNERNQHLSEQWPPLSDDENLEEEISLILAAIDDDRPMSGISSVYKRPPSVATTTTTVVHMLNREPRTLTIPAVRDNMEQNIQYDKFPNSYQTMIKEKHLSGEFGRRWSAHQSDVDSDYRREMATSTNSLHQEARGRDGGHLLVHPKSRMASGKRSGIDETDNVLSDTSTTFSRRNQYNNVSSSREEERRKVLEIEDRLERDAQMRRNAAAATTQGPVGRPGRTANIHVAGLRRGGQRVNSISAADAEISAPTNGSQIGIAKIHRNDTSRSNSRIRRTTSNAATPATGPINRGRRDISVTRKKLAGGSLTSSVNSSESEHESHAARSAVSRAATDVSRRSVFLHAAAVVDMPAAADRPSRALSADHTAGNRPVSRAASSTNLKNSKKISRSISLLTPWKPKNYREKFEVIHYDNRQLYKNPPTSITVGPTGATSTANVSAVGRPPRPPVPPVTRHRSVDKKSSSSTDLVGDPHPHITSSQPPSVSVLERRVQTLQKPGVSTKVSRSVSMPKDSKLAGWFRRRKKS